MIQVQGAVPNETGRFTINLQSTDNEEPDNVALHISVRWNDPGSPDSPVVVRNTKTHGSWGGEERDVPFFPFQAGEPFEIFIIAEDNEWQVSVNGEHLFSFSHRSDLYEVNHIGISGDVSIQSVHIF
jgi:hypothetical protein